METPDSQLRENTALRVGIEAKTKQSIASVYRRTL